jgi:hypothetical protein
MADRQKHREEKEGGSKLLICKELDILFLPPHGEVLSLVGQNVGN